MKRLSKLAILSIFALVTLSCASNSFAENTVWYEAWVSAVIDGDTILVQFSGDNPPPDCKWSERVRLIGVDTPELFTNPPEYFASQAKEYTRQWYGKDVLLAYDAVSAKRDKYGRMLAYVYPDIKSPSINYQLIINGYGYYYGTFAFEADKMVEFQYAEDSARSNKMGLWR
jgi:endonuclease YncB( thermonuclease family)